MILTELSAIGPDGRPFRVIFDYFSRHAIKEPWELDDELLLKHIRIVTRGFARKDITILRGLQNPQIHNLKRSIKECLNSVDYEQGRISGNSQDSVWCRNHSDSRRDDRSPIPRETLMDIVIRAFSDSLNRVQWCQKIFELLDGVTEFQNSLPLYELLSAMVEVNAEFVETGGIVPTRPPSPYEAHLKNRLKQAVAESISDIEATVVPRLTEKGRLNKEELEDCVNACRDYFEDLCQHGETDSVPSYFLSLRPELSQELYQKRYKSPIDSMFGMALKKVRQILRDDPTIWFERDY